MESLIKNILTSPVYDIALRTPLEYAAKLSERTGNNIWLKREDLQPIHSFKIRGAFHRISRLTDEEKGRGVICASAGNHAQGTALSAKHLGLRAVIVMPITTPAIKVQAVRSYGAEIVLHGDSYSDAQMHAEKLAASSGLVFIHPFDNEDVIAGQGTAGFEILQQMRRTDFVYVPVGGGGLISGIGAVFKELSPHTRVIGVEPADSNAMWLSLKENRRVTLDHVGIFADGVAVKTVGELTFAYCQKYVDDIVLVTTDEICSAIKLIYEDTRSVVEPAGALSVAGIMKDCKERGLKGAEIAAVNSGANMNFDRLQFVAERARTGEKREALFAVTIPEKPGALKEFTEKVIGSRNISEFNYRFNPGNQAHIFVGVGISGNDERIRFSEDLTRHGYESLDLTDNEFAKVHLRHIVGGRITDNRDEILFRFQFPEKPGALSNFLNRMSAGWNISLFHYRMHGGDFGRVLAGIQVPPDQREEFDRFLENLNYHYEEETGNPAYRLFL